MSASLDDNKWFFCFRVFSGSWVVEGPYDTYDRAKAERESAKAPDAHVTVPFAARSKEEAQAKCASH